MSISVGNVLIISPVSPFPSFEGNRARVRRLAETIEDLGATVFFALVPSIFRVGDPAAVHERFDGRVSSLTPVPMPIRKLQSIRRRFFPGATDEASDPNVDKFYRDAWNAPIRRLHQRHRFDAVFVEYVFLSKALENFGPEVLRVIDTLDRFAGRDERLARQGLPVQRGLSTDDDGERRAFARADRVIAIEPSEAEAFDRLAPGKVVTIGHLERPPEAPRPGTAERPTILLVGSINPPNCHGLAWFLHEVFPAIRVAVPEARLRIVGGLGNAVVQDDLPDEAVDTLGIIDEVDLHYTEAHLVINPVRIGTGLCVKSAEALARGKALLSTSAGVRGWTEQPCEIADEPAAFANKAIRLLRSESRRLDLIRQAEGRTHFHQDREQLVRLLRS